MKKFRWFTLLESLAVIGIIWIISTALYNMRNVWKDYRDYRQEAVNVIYKEIAQSLKDFQRNKIWKDSQWNEHEIDTFEVKFADTWKLEIWYTYIYCTSGSTDTIIPCYTDKWDFYQNNIQWSGYFDSITLISWQKYVSKKWIKGIDKYNFLISWDTEFINIYPNWSFDVWEDFIYDFVASIEEMTVAWLQTFTETIWEMGSIDWSACGRIRSECIDNLCTSNYAHHSNRRKAACVRQKSKNISPQDMSTLRTPRHSRRDRRLTFRWVWWANDRRRMDWCLQKSWYYWGGCDIKQRRKEEDVYNSTTITLNENYESTSIDENSVYLSFYIYANEENNKDCTIKQFNFDNDSDSSRVDGTYTPIGNPNDLTKPDNQNWTTITKGKRWRPIGKITINSVAKTVSLEWCNNDRIKNWINCWGNICQ